MFHILLAAALNGTIVASKDSRCNDIHINAIEGELRNFAQHPANASGQTDRATAIAQAQSEVQTERVILAGVCNQDEYLPMAARLFALDAWADVLGERNNTVRSPGPCPIADKKLMAAAAASAWTKLAQAASIPNPPALVGTLTPQIQALATEAEMTLPSFPEATQFWEQKYETAARAAIVDCASEITPTPIPHE
ncbi:MAG TPA: hypothetical protein VMB20_06965 [Candidatus Acidoferrum sp.]|nr:hypothetical protein [Candidatus Acidoferrum sp.]